MAVSPFQMETANTCEENSVIQLQGIGRIVPKTCIQRVRESRNLLENIFK